MGRMVRCVSIAVAVSLTIGGQLALAQGHQGPEEPAGDPIRARAVDGPDVFGYDYIDSSEANGPTFRTSTFRARGTQLPNPGDDVETMGLPLGFDFDFYGATFSQFGIDSNGYLKFTSGRSDFTNNCGYSELDHPDMVAPYWDDLSPQLPGAAIYYETRSPCDTYPPGSTAASCLVVQYQDVPHFNSTNLENFEAILYDDNDIVFQYSTTYNGEQGLQSLIGTNVTDNNLYYSCNTASISPNLAIHYRYPSDLSIIKDDGAATALTGAPHSYTVTVANAGPGDAGGVTVNDTFPAAYLNPKLDLRAIRNRHVHSRTGQRQYQRHGHDPGG